MSGMGNRFGEIMIGLGAVLGIAVLGILVIAAAVLFFEAT
jgi:hypothetical protein